MFPEDATHSHGAEEIVIRRWPRGVDGDNAVGRPEEGESRAERFLHARYDYR
jgi:hypothetical protein